jgi:hypothetical protein
MNPAPNIPNPPAFETAATKGGKDTHVMAPCMIGCFMPSISVILVLIYAPFVHKPFREFHGYGRVNDHPLVGSFCLSHEIDLRRRGLDRPASGFGFGQYPIY